MTRREPHPVPRRTPCAGAAVAAALIALAWVGAAPPRAAAQETGPVPQTEAVPQTGAPAAAEPSSQTEMASEPDATAQTEAAPTVAPNPEGAPAPQAEAPSEAEAVPQAEVAAPAEAAAPTDAAEAPAPEAEPTTPAPATEPAPVVTAPPQGPAKESAVAPKASTAPPSGPPPPPPPPKHRADWSKVHNPVASTEASIQRGRDLYNGRGLCYVCHGELGDGFGKSRLQFNPVPNAFFDPAWQQALSDGKFMGVLQEGKYGTGMIPIVPDFLTEQEAWDVINYVRTFQGKTSEAYERYYSDQSKKGEALPEPENFGGAGDAP